MGTISAPFLWVRIQIGSVFSYFVDPDPYSEYIGLKTKIIEMQSQRMHLLLIIFFIILKLTVFQIYFVFFFFLRCFCYCMKKSIKSLRSGTGSNRGKFLVPDPNYMFLIHKTGSNSNLALYLICVQYRIHF